MRERVRQTYTSMEIGLMKEENEQLKRRLERALEYIQNEMSHNHSNDIWARRRLIAILDGEEDV